MDKAKKAVEEFHHCNPQRPSAIHSVTTPLSDPRLYNEVTDTPGEGFITPPLKSTSDVIYPLHTKLVDDLIHTRTLPTSLLARIPVVTNRVWIYEAGLMDAVTFVMRMDPNNHPLRLYQFLNPLTTSNLHTKYEVKLPCQLSHAPHWMVRDHSHQLI